MTKENQLTPIEEVRKLGLEALMKTLGPADTIRFLQAIRPGNGNYTKERQKWISDLSIEDILKKMEEAGIQ